MSFQYDIGFLGGGQLARMSIQAAQRMGLRCLSVDSGTDTPAGQIADAFDGRLDDAKALARVFRASSRVTLENEFIRGSVLRDALAISERDEECLVPGITTLETIQDKLHQRRAYLQFGAPSPKAVNALDGPATFGFPHVLKARFGGYDGKGTRFVQSQEEFDQLVDSLPLAEWLAEEMVPFRRELAVMVYRTPKQTGCFPTMETVQVNHVCDLVFPSGCDASEVAISAVEAVNGYGLFGVELFELENGNVLINEIAPRPHNTGHYTLDWGGVSQFEQHVRLTMGWTCSEAMGQPAAMANLLGQENAKDYLQGIRAAMAQVPQCIVHWYGKIESRVGRKMGHINAVGPEAKAAVVRARDAFYSAWTTDEH